MIFNNKNILSRRRRLREKTNRYKVKKNKKNERVKKILSAGLFFRPLYYYG